MTVISTEDTWRLTHFFGLKLSNFQPVDKFKKLRARLSTGHIIRFVPTPFCHFRGACMLYDESTRILFSGDLFGGLSFDRGLFAAEAHWEGIRFFHQIYMPSQSAIRMAVEKIRRNPGTLFSSNRLKPVSTGLIGILLAIHAGVVFCLPVS